MHFRLGKQDVTKEYQVFGPPSLACMFDRLHFSASLPRSQKKEERVETKQVELDSLKEI